MSKPSGAETAGAGGDSVCTCLSCRLLFPESHRKEEEGGEKSGSMIHVSFASFPSGLNLWPLMNTCGAA